MTSKTAWSSFVIAFLLILQGASTANAYYNPSSGRFLSRDPIMYPDGANAYAAWYVPANVDPDGMLAVTVVETQQPKCNTKPAVVRWLFSLENDAPCNGFIVQKVTVKCGKSKCGDEIKTETYSYYEAWRVRKGKRTGDAFKGVDRFISSPSGCQKGTYEQTGEIRFYCNSAIPVGENYNGGAPGDGINGWEKGRSYSSTPSNCTTSAGGLWSKEAEPSFWGSLSGVTEYSYRWAKHDWNCCSSDKPCCGDGSVTAKLVHSP